jgi:hypothetical protein
MENLYFSWSYSTRNQSEILELRSELGFESYSIYMMLLETLAESDNYLKITYLGGLALNFGCKKEYLKDVINMCLNLELFFTPAENVIASYNLQKHFEKRETIRDIKRKAGAEGGKQKAENANNSLAPATNNLAPAKQNLANQRNQRNQRNQTQSKSENFESTPPTPKGGVSEINFFLDPDQLTETEPAQPSLKLPVADTSGPGERNSAALVEPPKTKITTAKVDWFEEFWQMYPRKTAKGKAKEAYKKAAKKILAHDLNQALKQRVPDIAAKDEQYQPHPATWLNQERWLDETAQSKELTWDEKVKYAKEQEILWQQRMAKRERDRQVRYAKLGLDLNPFPGFGDTKKQLLEFWTTPPDEIAKFSQSLEYTEITTDEYLDINFNLKYDTI